jgi:hypothetical protein
MSVNAHRNHQAYSLDYYYYYYVVFQGPPSIFLFTPSYTYILVYK